MRRRLSVLHCPSTGLLQVVFSHDATRGAAQECYEHRCHPETRGASTMMATDLMTPGAGGRHEDASVGGTFDGSGQTKIDSKVVDHYNE